MKKLFLALVLCALGATHANAGYTWKLVDYWYEGVYIHCEYQNYYTGNTYVWYHHRKYGCSNYRN